MEITVYIPQSEELFFVQHIKYYKLISNGISWKRLCSNVTIIATRYSTALSSAVSLLLEQTRR